MRPATPAQKQLHKYIEKIKQISDEKLSAEILEYVLVLADRLNIHAPKAQQLLPPEPIDAKRKEKVEQSLQHMFQGHVEFKWSDRQGKHYLKITINTYGPNAFHARGAIVAWFPQARMTSGCDRFATYRLNP